MRPDLDIWRCYYCNGVTAHAASDVPPGHIRLLWCDHCDTKTVQEMQSRKYRNNDAVITKAKPDPDVGM